MTGSWQDKAACASPSVDPELFFRTDDEGNIEQADLDRIVEMCHGCSVKRECAAFSIRPDELEQHGVWAGSTWRDRRHAVRKPDPIQYLMLQLDTRFESIPKRRGKVLRMPARKAVPAGYTHGLTGYMKRRCRCETCTVAARVYRASRKAAI